MSADKYPSIFSRQMKAIVYLLHAFLLIFILENLLQFPTTSSREQETEGNALEIGLRSVSEACKCLPYFPKVGEGEIFSKILRSRARILSRVIYFLAT